MEQAKITQAAVDMAYERGFAACEKELRELFAELETDCEHGSTVMYVPRLKRHCSLCMANLKAVYLGGAK